MLELLCRYISSSTLAPQLLPQVPCITRKHLEGLRNQYPESSKRSRRMDLIVLDFLKGPCKVMCTQRKAQVLNIVPSEVHHLILRSLISPIGKYRSTNNVPSKGKRDNKRKRKEVRAAWECRAAAQPPPPEISSFIITGLRSITRKLEVESKASKPKSNENEPADSKDAKKEDSSTTNPQEEKLPHFIAIFAFRDTHEKVLHAHLPQLVATSTLAHPNLPATRLIQLPKECWSRICEVLKLPRVSFLGLLDGAPHAKSLVDLILQNVPEIEAPWLEEVKNAAYLPVKINAIETTIGAAKEKKVV